MLGPAFQFVLWLLLASSQPLHARYFGGMYQDQERILPAVGPNPFDLDDPGTVPISALEALAQAPVVDSNEVSSKELPRV